MRRRPITRFQVWREVLTSRWSYVSLVLFVATFYALARSEFVPSLPALGSVVPWWGWAIMALLALNVATLESAYRIAVRLQPPLQADISRHFHKLMRQADDLRPQGMPPDIKGIERWFETVIGDLAKVFGVDYAERKRKKILASRNVHSGGIGLNHKWLLRETRSEIDEILGHELRDELISADENLSSFLASDSD